MNVLRHWLAEAPAGTPSSGPAVAWSEQTADEYRRMGWTVTEWVPADDPRGAVSETEQLRHEVQARDDVIYHAAEHLRHALDVIAAYEDRITTSGQ
jgi:hypothetical protein